MASHEAAPPPRGSALKLCFGKDRAGRIRDANVILHC